jgi:hypothetical protein
MGWMAPLRHLGAKVLVGEKPAADREPSMNEITTVGLDLAKNVFQVHAVDAGGTRFCASSFGGRRCWHSSADYRGVWWGWRRVRRRITGRASCVRWAMRCG